MTTRPDKTSPAAIAGLNDALRRGLCSGRVVLSAGVAALPEGQLRAVLQAVRSYEAFTPDNDPYGEHDFGSFEYVGQRYCWKIDYYDVDCCYCSPDPADPLVTTRVMTIMRSDEH